MGQNIRRENWDGRGYSRIGHRPDGRFTKINVNLKENIKSESRLPVFLEAFLPVETMYEL